MAWEAISGGSWAPRILSMVRSWESRDDLGAPGSPTVAQRYPDPIDPSRGPISEFEDAERSIIASRRERLTSVGGGTMFDGFSPSGSAHAMDDDYDEEELYDDAGGASLPAPSAPSARMTSSASVPRMNGHRQGI